MPGSDSRSGKTTLIHVVVLAIISTHFGVAYITSTKSYIDLTAYANGSAPLPFQYRVLPSWILHAGAKFPPLQAIAAMLPPPFSEPERLVWLMLCVISMATLIELARRSIGCFVEDDALSTALAYLMPVSIYINYVALASTYRNSYPYDLPALALFVSCVYSILSNNLVALYGLFPLATLSRETSVFLLVFFILFRWKTSFRSNFRDLLHLAALAAIWVVIKVWVASLYPSNLPEEAYPGIISHYHLTGQFIFQLSNNFANLSNPIYWPSLLSFAGWLYIPVILKWHSLDKLEIKRTISVLTPLWFAGMFCVGRITELRVFGELTIYYVIAVAIIVRNYLEQRGYRFNPPAPVRH